MGSNINAETKEKKETPLHIAAEYGSKLTLKSNSSSRWIFNLQIIWNIKEA